MGNSNTRLIIKKSYELTYYENIKLVNLLEDCHGRYPGFRPLIQGDVIMLVIGNGEKGILSSNEKLVATLQIADEGEFYEIQSVSTHISYRRRGYANKLIKTAIQYINTIDKTKSKDIRLEVDINNRGALKLYTKLNFVIMNHNGNDKQIDSYIMKLAKKTDRQYC